MKSFNRLRQTRTVTGTAGKQAFSWGGPRIRCRALGPIVAALSLVVVFAGLTLSLGRPHLSSLNPGMPAPEAAPLPQPPPPLQRYQPKFRDLVGSNGGFDSEIMNAMKVGWIRESFTWDEIEPSPGKWNWKLADGRVETNHARNTEILPALLYTAHWAASGRDGFSPPKNSADWIAYVTATVSRYTAAPFNLRYFQIWNEPTRDAGFWKGSDQQFIDDIYIPAAKIIRQHNAFVVFGGWGQGDGIPRYNQELNYHNAWQWTDILDIHYYPLSAMQTLYTQWIATGKCKGIWQTEVGNLNNPVYLTNLYSGVFNWAKKSGNWTFPEQYKLFWYAGAGPGCAVCLVAKTAQNKQVLTANGHALEKLAQSMP